MKGKIILSATTAFFFAFLSYIVLEYLYIEQSLLLSVAAGLLFYILLRFVLILYDKVMEKRYRVIEQGISSPIFYKTNGNFNLANGKIKNGNIYFCETGILFATLEEKPFIVEELLLADIKEYEYSVAQIKIIANDGRVYLITMPDVKNVVNVLKEKEWIF